MTIDGKPVPETLFSLVKDTWKANKNNSVIGFKDNSRCVSFALHMSSNRMPELFVYPYLESNMFSTCCMLDSAIRGTAVKPVLPVTPGSPCPVDAVDRDFDVLFTAETHNFPCAVS